MKAEIEQPPELPTFDEILRALMDAPERRERRKTKRIRERPATQRDSTKFARPFAPATCAALRIWRSTCTA